jgi:dihydropyrimidinase
MTGSVDLRLAGGEVVTTETVLEADVLVDGETIVGVVAHGAGPDADTTVDATDRLILPGVVDPHVHIDGPNSIERYETGTAAAALGGVTTLINFAWQPWVGEGSIWDAPGSLADGYDRQRRLGRESRVDFGLHGTITREESATLDELEALVERGVTSFKIFTTYEFGLSNGFVEEAMERIADTGAVLVIHTEDDSVCTRRTERAKEAGRGAPTDYPASRPAHAEAMAADDAVRMALETGVKYYGFHTSCRAAAAVLDGFREDGSRIRAETCPHYTTLTESAYAEQGLLPVIAPPLRTPDDRDAMFEYLRNGTLSVVSTDHVAFTESAKDVDDWWDGSFGANSLQHSLAVLHDEAVNRRGFSYPFLARVLAAEPAATFGFDRKGRIAPGMDADLVVFDPEETYTVSAAENASKADYSVYEGRELTGRVKQTFRRGERIAADGEVLAAPGSGEYVDRSIPDWSV